MSSTSRSSITCAAPTIFMIGERTAEDIKIKIGSAYAVEKESTMEVKGRDLVAGLPKTLTITSQEVREAMAEPVQVIVESIRITLERCPPELSADLVERGNRPRRRRSAAARPRQDARRGNRPARARRGRSPQRGRRGHRQGAPGIRVHEEGRGVRAPPLISAAPRRAQRHRACGTRRLSEITSPREKKQHESFGRRRPLYGVRHRLLLPAGPVHTHTAQGCARSLRSGPSARLNAR